MIPSFSRAVLFLAVVATAPGCQHASDAAPYTDVTDTADADAAGPDEPRRDPAEWWRLGQADPVLDEVGLYYLGQTWHQGADVAEVLETLSRVAPDDPTSWTREWLRTAQRLEALGDASEAAGHPLTAGAALQRASTYYRAALHRHMDPTASEVGRVAARAVAAHERFLRLTGSPCAPVAIPYLETTLPGYFCAAPGVDGPAPTLIFHEGKDGWAEDGKFLVDAAMVRGYHVLTFDGPGIGKTIRLQGLPFRHDWEAVITPVVDYLLTRAEVDPARLGLVAVSLGGYLAPRAAAFEHRLAALVVNPGVLDWAAVYDAELSYIDPALPGLLDRDPAAFDATVAAIMAQSDFMRWGIVDSMWHHGATTPSGLMFEIRRYRLGELAGQIRAKTLVMDAEAEGRGQARQLYDALTCPKTYVRFEAEEAAQFHVQPGATGMLTHRIVDWLDDNL